MLISQHCHAAQSAIQWQSRWRRARAPRGKYCYSEARMKITTQCGQCSWWIWPPVRVCRRTTSFTRAFIQWRGGCVMGASSARVTSVKNRRRCGRGRRRLLRRVCKITHLFYVKEFCFLFFNATNIATAGGRLHNMSHHTSMISPKVVPSPPTELSPHFNAVVPTKTVLQLYNLQATGSCPSESDTHRAHHNRTRTPVKQMQ